VSRFPIYPYPRGFTFDRRFIAVFRNQASPLNREESVNSPRISGEIIARRFSPALINPLLIFSVSDVNCSQEYYRVAQGAAGDRSEEGKTNEIAINGGTSIGKLWLIRGNGHSNNQFWYCNRVPYARIE